MSKINWIAAVLIASTHVVAQQAHTPPAGRQPVVTTPSTSGVQVTPRTANSPYTSAPATMTKMKVAAGNVQGYVIWDASAVQYKLSTPCQGLQVTLVDPSNNQGQTLASSSNLTPLSSTPQWNFTGGSKGPWMVCGYSFHQVPEKQVLQVRAAITQPSAFSPQAFVKQVPGANGTNLVLATGNCNNPPDSTLSTILASTSVICGGYAFNINLEIFAPATPARGSVPATGVKLLPNASATNQPAPGMLLSASPPTGRQQNATPSSSATRGHLLQLGQGGGDASPSVPNGSRQGITDITNRTGGHGPTITTRDVISMLKAGLPESTIISSIRSSNHQFDFSRENLQALHDAHASPAVLVAMCDGSARSCPALQGNSAPATPGSKLELNPQPFPPRVAPSTTPANAASLQRGKSLAKSLQLKNGPKIDISNAPLRAMDSGIAQVLQQESAETHNLKLALRSGNFSSGGQTGLAHLEDATDPAADGSTPGDPTGGSPGGGSTPPGGKSKGGFQPGANPVIAGTPSTNVGNGVGQNSLVQRAAKANQPISACRFTADPVIENVSGRLHNIVFTPDPGSGQYPNNQYVIRGCNYGDIQGQVKVFGAFINNPSPVNLGIDSWTDSLILVTFNPAFQNEYDLKSITLTVVRKDGHSTQLPGISFYASRVSRPLARVPHSIVKLPTDYFQIKDLVSPVTTSSLQSAGLSPIPQPASAVFYLYDPIWSSNVGDGYPQNRLSFSDSIDITKLRSGFVLDPGIQSFVAGGPTNFLGSGSSVGVDGGSCKYADTELSAATQGNSLLIGVQPAECDNSGKFIYALYGLEVSVTGPKGNLLDPWPSGLQ